MIMWLKSKVDTSKTFELCVSRDNMLERGLKLWKHNKKATPIPCGSNSLERRLLIQGPLEKSF